ncbi:MAG: hypothetical protein PVSMB4_08020 [Ktedonobacterales bacterium]
MRAGRYHPFSLEKVLVHAGRRALSLPAVGNCGSAREEEVEADHTGILSYGLALGRQPTAEPRFYYRGRFRPLGPAVAPAAWVLPDPADLVADW